MSWRDQRGVSLVEIMIALVLGMVLSAGVLQVFVANKQAYRSADATSRVQENARFAMDILTKDIRMAGYKGCAGETRSLVNTLNSPSSFLYDFDAPLVGFEATSSSSWSPSLHSSIVGENPLGGTDIITVRGILDGGGAAIVGQPSNAGDCSNASSHTANLKVDDAAGLAVGDIVIASSCASAAVFQITQVNIASDNVVHNTGGSTIPGNATKDLGACFAGNGELVRITTRSFYIRNNADGIPSLYLKDGTATAEELIEGVENMQVLYGEDTNVTFDGSANQFVRANDVTDWDRVVSVRISLLLRSPEDNVVTAPQTYSFNDATPTAGDRRLRRVYTTTIGLRNRTP